MLSDGANSTRPPPPCNSGFAYASLGREAREEVRNSKEEHEEGGEGPGFRPIASSLNVVHRMSLFFIIITFSLACSTHFITESEK